MLILLTGGAGFVGHHTLAHFLKTTDYTFVVTDSFKHKGTSSRLRSIFEEIPSASKRIKVITHDLTTPIDFVTLREFGDVNAIISMASESHVDRSIAYPINFITNNVSLILNTLECARLLNNLQLFIQISTDEVYGPAPQLTRHKEGDTHYPSNPYSASKSAQESICHSYWRTFGLPIVITNTMNIFGERQDKEKFIPIIIKNLFEGSPIPVHSTKIRNNWVSGSRYYLHARNQADALKHLIQNKSELNLHYSNENTILEKFHVVGEKELNNYELANLIAKFLDLECKIEYVDFHTSRPGHDLRYALDGSKLLKFGWNPPLSLESSLEKTVMWYSNNRNWLR